MSSCGGHARRFAFAWPAGLYMAYSLSTLDESVARTKKAFDHAKAAGEVEHALNAQR